MEPHDEHDVEPMPPGSEDDAPVEPAPSPPPARTPRPYERLALLVILLVCGAKIAGVVITSLGLVRADDAESERIVSLNAELLAKIVVGGIQLSPGSGELFLSQAEALGEAAPADRLAYVMLTAEVSGPEAAEALLGDQAIIPEPEVRDTEWTGREQSLLAIVRKGIEDRLGDQPGLPSISEEDRDRLELSAGWLGSLFLHPPGTPDASGRDRLLESLTIIPIVFVAVMLVLGGLGLGGLVGLIVFFVLAWQRRVHHGFVSGEAAVAGIYLETFALWTVVFLGWPWLAGMLVGLGVLSADVAATLTVAGFFASLITLLWPVARGLPWRQVRAEIGWTTGRGLGTETLVGGLGGYAMALPIVAFGLLVTSLLMQLQQHYLPEAPAPSHPAQQMAASGNFWVIVQLYVLACIAAPLVEETMFRGVLYRYFRDRSRHWRLATSFLFSAFCTSLLFAAIHPQGLATVPVLMSLAIGFCFIREWRGTLLAPMTAHGVNNFLIISLNIALFGVG